MARRLLVVMGPSGAGKSTVGALAAKRLGVPFYEGDAYHPEENVERMRAGRPLELVHRRPWLDAIGRAVGRQDHPQGVLACSALNGEIRRLMAELIPAELTFVLLDVPERELRRRLEKRQDHFMGPALLPSQLAAMDAMEGIARLDGTMPAADLARAAAALFVGER